MSMKDLDYQTVAERFGIPAYGVREIDRIMASELIDRWREDVAIAPNSLIPADFNRYLRK